MISPTVACQCHLSLTYSKAFDTRPHETILAKLKFFGYSVNTVAWFASYLEGRTQRVKWCDTFSEETAILAGVPQGSILGPFAFAVHVADLPDAVHGIPECSVAQYVDDTQVYCRITPAQAPVAVHHLNAAISSICTWSTANGLLLNPSKSVVLCCGSGVIREKVIRNLPNIIVNDVPVSVVHNARNLGVVFDSSLSFEAHVIRLIGYAYAKLKYLYQFKHVLSSEVKWKLCNTLVLSALSYCSSTYYPFLNQQNKDRVQKVQNSCFRFAFAILRTEHITRHYNEKGILKMSFVFLTQYLCLLYKTLQNKQPVYLYELLRKRSDIHNSNLRNVHLFHIPSHSSTKFENSFSFMAVKLFNKYNEFFVRYVTVISFRAALKKHLLIRQCNYDFAWY